MTEIGRIIFVAIVTSIITGGVIYLVKFFLGSKTKDDFITKEICMNCIARAVAESVKNSLKEFSEEVKMTFKQMQDKQADLREQLPKEYVRISDYKEDISEIKIHVNEMNKKLDRVLEIKFKNE